MQKRTFQILLVFLSLRSATSADLKFTQYFMVTTMHDIDVMQVPAAPSPVRFYSIYTSGYYFLDGRLIHVGQNDWGLRGNVRAKGLVRQSKYKADLRTLYIENKKPVAGKFFFTAGRMKSNYLNPIFRLDGAEVAYQPSTESNFLFGISGGQIPKETSGYVNSNIPGYAGGIFSQYKNEKADQINLQYSARSNNKKEIIHQGQIQTVKNYTLLGNDSFFRTGVLYSVPGYLFDYAYAENGITLNKTVTHSLSYMQSETIYYITETFQRKERFREASYRLYYNTNDSRYKFTNNIGYSYSMAHHGFVEEFRFFRKDTFTKGGLLHFDATARKRGLYTQYMGMGGYGMYPLMVVNLDFNLGYEYVVYHNYGSQSVLFNLTIDTPISRQVNIDFLLDLRYLLGHDIETYFTMNVMHNLNFKIGGKKKATTDEVPL